VKSDYQLLLTTCPNLEVAESLSCLLLEKHLVSCVNILPNTRSFYELKGKIVNESEVLLFIQTGLPSYLAWLDETTNLDKH